MGPRSSLFVAPHLHLRVPPARVLVQGLPFSSVTITASSCENGSSTIRNCCGLSSLTAKSNVSDCSAVSLYATASRMWDVGYAGAFLLCPSCPSLSHSFYALFHRAAAVPLPFPLARTSLTPILCTPANLFGHTIQRCNVKMMKKKTGGSRRSSLGREVDGDCGEYESSECDEGESSSVIDGLGQFGGGPGRGGGGRNRSALCAPPPPPQAKPAMAQVEGGTGGMGAVSFVVDKPADIK